jgi:Family of unknown function (DUF5681)
VSKKSRGRSVPNPGWFPKGRSGNPRGRPRSSRAQTGSTFNVLLDKTLTVPDRGGGTRDITVEAGLQQRTFQDALAGKRMAVREVMKWILKRDAWLAKHEPKAPRLIPRFISPDPDNADAALVLLGIAVPDPAPLGFVADRAPLLLESWAVQAALARRRGGQRLTEHELGEVRRCTRDSDSLRWPRGTGR